MGAHLELPVGALASARVHQPSHIRAANRRSSRPLTSPYIPVVRSEAWPSHRCTMCGGTAWNAATPKVWRRPLSMAAEPESAARLITSLTQRHAVLPLHPQSRTLQRLGSNSRPTKSKTTVRPSISVVGTGTCLTTATLRRFKVMNAIVPASRSIAIGVIASASEIRQPLHMSKRQKSLRSGGIVSAAAAKRWRSAAFRYFRAPAIVWSVITPFRPSLFLALGGFGSGPRNTMANNVARELARIFEGFGEGWNDNVNLSAINATNYTAKSMH
jgi:hypothetical protein